MNGCECLAVAGHDVDLCLLLQEPAEAGTEDKLLPAHELGDLSSEAPGGLDLLLGMADTRQLLVLQGADVDVVARRIRLAARLVGMLLPAALQDVHDRFTVTLDDVGLLPDPGCADLLLCLVPMALRCCLCQRDAGAWVDPNAVADAVADVHDAAGC